MAKTIRREYPSQPIVGVGAVVVKDGEVLLVKRGKNPSFGEWSIPGGAVKTGESLKNAVLREIKEETGLTIDVKEPVEVLERIFRDKNKRVKYHYVLIDYLGKYIKGKLKPSSDVLDACFVSPEKLDSFNVKEITKNIIEKALKRMTALETSKTSGETGIIK